MSDTTPEIPGIPSYADGNVRVSILCSDNCTRSGMLHSAIIGSRSPVLKRMLDTKCPTPHLEFDCCPDSHIAVSVSSSPPLLIQHPPLSSIDATHAVVLLILALYGLNNSLEQLEFSQVYLLMQLAASLQAQSGLVCLLENYALTHIWHNSLLDLPHNAAHLLIIADFIQHRQMFTDAYLYSVAHYRQLQRLPVYLLIPVPLRTLLERQAFAVAEKLAALDTFIFSASSPDAQPVTDKPPEAESLAAQLASVIIISLHRAASGSSLTFYESIINTSFTIEAAESHLGFKFSWKDSTSGRSRVHITDVLDQILTRLSLHIHSILSSPARLKSKKLLLCAELEQDFESVFSRNRLVNLPDPTPQSKRQKR